MNNEKSLSCIILCGGMSRRMGEDKGSMKIQDKPMILYILDTLNHMINEVVIVLNDERRVSKYSAIINQYQKNNKPFDFTITYVKDEIQNKGPLSGILTGLKNISTDYGLILPCDSPYIKKEYINTMINTLENLNDHTIEAIIPKHTNKNVKSNIEPLHSVYKKGNEDCIFNLIKNNKLSVNDYIQNLNVHYVLIDNMDIEDINFKNLNSKEDL
ncbi:MAG: molybdenum cofactor guanylyltransferase [Methanobacteriaceae archaeon]|nr:molybdenum cofactor guanylyltransferase [Methanobacteriaceae archaeon]